VTSTSVRPIVSRQLSVLEPPDRRQTVRIAVLLLAAALVAGCAGGAASPTPPSSASAAPSVGASGGASASAAPPSPPAAATGSAASSAGGQAAVDAAHALLAASSARFDLTSGSVRADGTSQATARASGEVNPARDLGAMRYMLFPDDPANPLATAFEVRWSPSDFWFAQPDSTGDASTWQHAPRVDARDMAFVGRVQEEPLALVRFAAAADASAFEPLPAEELEGRQAERWLIRVPTSLTEPAYVPPDVYAGFEEAYGIDHLPLEVWLVDGAVARTGYVLSRTSATSEEGNRVQTWYDWSDVGAKLDIEVPPTGTIVEAGGA